MGESVLDDREPLLHPQSVPRRDHELFHGPLFRSSSWPKPGAILTEIFNLGENVSVLRVYSISALRFVAYLTLGVGPLATVTGIVVDVLFYLAPAPPLSTADVLRARFRMPLE